MSQVESEIAPDLMQYGLRIVRWGNLALQDIAQTIDPQIVDPEVVMAQARRGLRTTKYAPITTVEFANALLLGRQVHDEDHRSSRIEAIAMRSERLPKVASLLLQTAHMQSDRGNFDLQSSLETRLMSLRERFDVPRLDSV